MKDLIETRFDMLEVIEFSHRELTSKKGKYRYYWKCKCDCGKIVIRRADRLRKGKSVEEILYPKKKR